MQLEAIRIVTTSKREKRATNKIKVRAASTLAGWIELSAFRTFTSKKFQKK